MGRRKGKGIKAKDLFNKSLITPIPVEGAKLTGAPEKERLPKYKQSGHYIDQKLTHNYERDHKGQLSLFESISPQTLEKIGQEEVIVEGIRLTVIEDRLLNSILRLLHEKSNKDRAGNLPPTPVDYGGSRELSPRVRLTPHELYTEVAGTKDYSGAELKVIKSTLIQLQDRKFLIIYKRRRRDSKGKELIDRIEEYQPLIKIVTYYEGLTQEEDEKLDQGDPQIKNEKGEIILGLNPIFIDQIDTKFIDYPTDINKLTAIASGGAKKVTTAITRLRDYFLRAITYNRKGNYLHRIDVDKLPYICGLETYIHQRRRRLIEARINEAIEACINLGLITKVTTTSGVGGQAQYEFTLNLEY